MAVAGYGTEATWESIFNVAASEVDADRFGFMNIHIGTQFNFYITGDAAVDITDARITGMLAATTHQLIFEIYMRAKGAKHVQPWDAAVVEMGQVDFKTRYKNLILECQQILYGIMDLSTCNLSSDRSY